MEGVMMKSDVGIAMAVRREDGKIVKSYKSFRSKAQKGTFWGLPIVRGVAAFVESLSTGLKTTTESAEMYGESVAEEEPSRFEKWLSKTFKVDIMNVVLGVAMVLGVLMAVGLFIFLPTLISGLFFSGKSLWRTLVEGGIRVLIYIGYLFAVSAIKDIRRVFMYHGAEHKTIACYEADEEQLTPANAMKYRRLHPRCGTNYLFLVMAISIFVLTIVDAVILYGFNFDVLKQTDSKILDFLFRFGVRIVCLPLIAGISYEVLRWAAKRDNWFTKIVRAPGMALQYITTKEPTEDMLEVAIASFYLAMQEPNPLEKQEEEEEKEKEKEAASEAVEKAVENAVEEVEKAVEETVDRIKDTAEQAAEAAEKAIEDIKN